MMVDTLSCSMVESLRYEVVTSHDRFEVRRYPLTVLATVHGMSDDDAFSLLFSYISGDNSRKEKVPMTAPVFSSDEHSVHIPMTSPVISNSRSLSFVLPSVYRPGEVPEPLDRRVQMEVLPERQVAVLRFRGRTRSREVEERTRELLDEVRSKGLVPSGDTFLMRYNPPFTPGFLRRNEVAVEVGPSR